MKNSERDNPVEMTRHFNSLGGVKTPWVLTGMDHSAREFWTGLLMEEVNEFRLENSASRQMKEIADILYVAVGTAMMLGLTWQEVMELFVMVHDSNMTKVSGGAEKSESGKIMKSSSYIPAQERIDVWLSAYWVRQGRHAGVLQIDDPNPRTCYASSPGS